MAHTPLPTDVWIARVRWDTNGRLDRRKRVTKSASSRASTSPRNRPAFSWIRGCDPDEHHGTASSSPSQAAVRRTASTCVRVRSGRRGASHAPSARLTPRSCITWANVVRSTSTTAGGSSSSRPRGWSRMPFEHQKSSTTGPDSSWYTPATATRVEPIEARSPAPRPIRSTVLVLTQMPGPGTWSTTSTWSSAPPRTSRATSIGSTASPPASGAESRLTHQLLGPTWSARPANGSGDGLRTAPGAAVNARLRPVSRGHRSSTCSPTAALPTDEAKSGTAERAAATTAQAPAVASSSPTRRRSRRGARRHGADERVASASRTRSTITGRRR
jgi:hypothetical protein